MADIGCVVFDLDGVLHDSASGIADALNDVMIADGLEPLSAEVVKTLAGDNSDSIVPKAYKHQGFTFVPYEANPRQQTFRERLLARAVSRDDLFPGALETLDALRARNIKLALCTNGFHDITMSILGRLGLADRFDAIICGLPQSPPKPDPSMVRDAIAKASVDGQGDPSATVMVIARKEDVKAAKGAGCIPVAVDHGYGQGAADAWGAAATLASLDALPDWIARLDR